jgi:hypothetical protein
MCDLPFTFKSGKINFTFEGIRSRSHSASEVSENEEHDNTSFLSELIKPKTENENTISNLN